MKQIWPDYSYSPATNVLTLTGLNIDRDQLLLVAAPERGRIMYNFADSAVTASAYTAGANTALTLVASTAGLTTTASLVIYYDDQLQSTAITISNFPATQPVSIASVTIGNTVTIAGTVTANPTGTQTIAGTVTANATLTNFPADNGVPYIPIAFVDTPGGSFIQVSQDPNCGLPISGTVTVGNSVTIGSLPAISGTVTANTFALQGTAVTTSDFTSTTASTLLAGYNATREVLTIFNEGAGNLHICAGATCTTIAYQVRLSAGDYYEVPNHQTTITHSAVFATAGTARVTEVS